MTIDGYLLTVEEQTWENGSVMLARVNRWSRQSPAQWLVTAQKEADAGTTLVVLGAVPLDEVDWRATKDLRVDAGTDEYEPAEAHRILSNGTTSDAIMGPARGWLAAPVELRRHRPVFYIAHPVGAPTPVGIAENAARARRWLAALMHAYPDVAWCCPWLPYLDVMDDDNPVQRARCLLDDVVIAARCDGIVLCGTKAPTPGMLLERQAVRSTGGVVIEFPEVEPRSPWVGIDIAATVPRRRA